MTRRYTEENIAFIREKSKIEGMTEKELTKLYNAKFEDKRTTNSLKYIRSKHGILLNNQRSKSGAGLNRRGSKPIGTERVRKDYVEIKVKQPNVWEQKHRHIWEQYHGRKLKHNEVVIFLDKNNRNFDINNLAAVPRGVVGLLNLNNWTSENPEHTKLGIETAKLLGKIYEKETSE